MSVSDIVQATSDHVDHLHHKMTVAKAKTVTDKCDHCTPYCASVAIPTAYNRAIAVPVISQDFAALIVAELSIHRSRLDRPPRFFIT